MRVSLGGGQLLLELARCMTAAQLERMCRLHRQMGPSDVEEEQHRERNRYLRTRQTDDGGGAAGRFDCAETGFGMARPWAQIVKTATLVLESAVLAAPNGPSQSLPGR